MGGLALDVTQQQQVERPGADREHHARVVGHRTRGDAPRRPPHLGRHTGPLQCVPGLEGLHRYAACPRPPRHLAVLVGGFGHRAHEHLADLATAQGAGQPVDVVGVEVGEDDRVEHADVEPAQATVDRRGLRAGVHEHRVARGRGEDQPVALPDVTGHEPPPVEEAR